MSWTSDYIAKHGKEAHNKLLKYDREKNRKWYRKNIEKLRIRRQNDTKKLKERAQAQCRKGGKYYERNQIYLQTGLQGERHKIRVNHGYKWRPFKKIIAPNSQIHHCWQGNTADYNFVALVEADAHIHGIINVIHILEGKITLSIEESWE